MRHEHPVSGTRPSSVALVIVATCVAAGPRVAADTFDHSYQPYGALLTAIVRGDSVDYSALVSRRGDLDVIARQFGAPSETIERGWTRLERMAFWINAYNLFTLQAIATHYPIRGRFFTLLPRNSIRQIDGVWTNLRFRVASRELTLDDIEHSILRPAFKDARVHFAINCASVSCPPLAAEPYVAGRLDAQLDDAARRYLASPHGVQVSGRTLRVSSIFKWYGADFIAQFGDVVAASRTETERAILGTLATYGPPAAQQVARSADARLRFLSYDWSLNDSNR